MQEQLPRSQGWQGSDHIHVSWIPAVHAGMTCYLSKVIGDKSAAAFVFIILIKQTRGTHYDTH